jgi:transmembrane sensor
VDKYTEINELILKHLKQELTPEESATLSTWIEQSDLNRRFFARINDSPALMAEVRALAEGKKIDLDAAWARIKAVGWETPVADTPKRVIKWWHYAAAVAAVVIVSVGIFLFRQTDKPAAPVVVQTVPQDPIPNTHKAYLTLDNGERIDLDSLANGLLATQGNTQVVKYDDGALRYMGGKETSSKTIYNKVTVPRGSDVVYLQLSDGTKVWLNAASSIRYPVEFNEADRKVEITGEAYFEAAPALKRSAKNGEKKRFIVNKGGMNVIVVGTRFNVNTYDNEENIKVTLLEGRVKVQSHQLEKNIQPGQQAIVANAKINIVDDVDLEQVMAWKEGKFIFSNTNIQLIMRQMERWYDLEPTRFENNEVKQWEFNGEVSRYSNASKVLQLLEKTGSVKFSIDGKKIVVKPH